MAKNKEIVFHASCGKCGLKKVIVCMESDRQDRADAEHNKHDPNCEELSLGIVSAGVVNPEKGMVSGTLPYPIFSHAE